LKLVQLMSAGYNRFNLDGARAARLPVAVNGGANAIAVAEHAIMLMLSALKRLHALDAAVRSGQWRGSTDAAGRVHELYQRSGRHGPQGVEARRLAGWGTVCVLRPRSHHANAS
jgi:glyoxylate reductase/D-3-phosphoglycerate dehydrogenase